MTERSVNVQLKTVNPQSADQLAKDDIRKISSAEINKFAEDLQKQSTRKNPSYWWLNNRLIKVGNDDLPPSDSNESASVVIESVYPFDSTACVENHVKYVWNKLFKYPGPLDQAIVRITGTSNYQETNKIELINWMLCAVDKHSSDIERQHSSELITSLDFVLDQMSTNFENGIAKRQSVSTFELLYSNVGYLEGVRCSLNWINSLPTYKRDDPNVSVYKVFHTILKGAPRSEKKALGLTSEAVQQLGEIQPCSESFENDFNNLVKCLVTLGLEENEVQHFIGLIFAAFYISLISCEENEGKLILSGERNLSMAAQLLQVENSVLKNALILNVKYSGKHRLTEGYKTAANVNKARDNLISVLYNFICAFVIEKANKQFPSTDMCTKSINLLMTPSLSFENATSPTHAFGYSGFVRNFLADFLIEVYSENTEDTLVLSQRREGVQPTPQGKAAVASLQPQPAMFELTESISKKSVSFLETLQTPSGKKSPEKVLYELIKKAKYQKIKAVKKHNDIFEMLLFDSPNFPLKYNIHDVISTTQCSRSPELIEFLQTSPNIILTNLVSSDLAYVSEFATLVNLLFTERKTVSQNSPLFLYCFSGNAQLPLISQLQLYRIPELLSKEEFCERLPHEAFLSRYGCLGLNSNTQPPRFTAEFSSLLVSKIRFPDAVVGENIVFLKQAHIYTLDKRLERYHQSVLLLQCHFRRWKAYKFLRDLRIKADQYKLFAGEKLLEYSAQLCEFQEFCKYSYFHDLQRADCSLLHNLLEKVKKQTPKNTKYWANLIVMEHTRPVYVTVLQHDITMVTYSQVTGSNHVSLSKVSDMLTSDEAKEALKTLKPGLILEMSKDYSVTVNGNTAKPLQIWGHWMNFGRNFIGGLKEKRGVIEDRTNTSLFVMEDFKRSIAESLITRQVNLEQLELECLIPIIICGQLNSLHDSPLWLLLVHYGPMEAIKTKEMQRDVRIIKVNLVSNGDLTSNRAWSKIHCQRDILSSDTDLKSQLQMIARKDGDEAQDEDRKELLKALDSSKERRGFNLSSGKVWSKQIHQTKLYYMNKDKK